MTSYHEQANDVDSAIAEYLNRSDRGESIDRERFLRSHHGVSAELSQFFEDWDHVSWYYTTKCRTLDETRTTLDMDLLDGLVRIDAKHFTEGGDRQYYQFGDYELLEELGRGGMGIVYKAHQLSLDRIVCVKMMLMAELAEEQEFRRFRAEAMAIARLNVPGIVAIHEVGQHKGTPYYTMEYVEGEPLSKSILERPLPARTAAEYVAQIAESIHVAHSRGIVHRDLKPSNIIVDNQHRAHITDFGLAKHLESGEDLTVTGQVLGTPTYMSPEQAMARHDKVDHSTDIYSLGAVLYALLTGKPPHRAETALETVRQVATRPPIAPRVLNADVPRDLETICLKCLDKQSSARYATAQEVADDLRRFLDGEAIRARPLGPAARAMRWVGRHPAISALSASVILIAALAAIGLTAQNLELSRLYQKQTQNAKRLSRALRESRENERTARNLQYVSDMPRVEQLWLDGDYRGAVELLNRDVPAPGQVDLRGYEWHVLKQRRGISGETIAADTYPLYVTVFSHDGRRLAVAGGSGTVRLYDGENYDLVAEIPTGQIEVNGVAFSSDGRRLATAGDDGSVRVWDLDSLREVLAIEAFGGHAFTVAFCAGDRILVACGVDRTIRMWNARTGEPAGELEGHTETVDAFAVSDDGRYLQSVAGDLRSLLFDLKGRKRIGVETSFAARPTCVAFSPQTDIAVSGSIARRLRITSANSPEATYLDVSHPTQSVAISPDGQLLAAGDRNGSVNLWSIRPAAEAPCGCYFDKVMGWSAHDGRVYSLAFARDNRQLVSVGSDGRARQWDVEQLMSRDEFKRWPAGNSNEERGMAFLAKSALLISANPEAGVELWHCATPSDAPARVFAIDRPMVVACSSDGLQIGAGTEDGTVQVWQTETGVLLHEWHLGLEIHQLEFSPDKRWLAVVTAQRESAFRQTQIFRLRDGGPVFPKPVRNWRAVGFAPDSRRLYVALDVADHVIAWNLAEEAVAESFNYHDTTIDLLRVSPDGQYVVSASSDRQVLLHHTSTLADRVIRTGLHGDVNACAFGPWSRSLIVADSLGVVRVCNLHAAQRVLDLVRVFDPGEPSSLAISEDGRFLALRWQQDFRVYDLLPGSETTVVAAQLQPK